MKKPDGGSLFPWTNGDPRDASSGASVRDYFAGEALKGLLAANDSLQGLTLEQHAAAAARGAFIYAAAMIAEREK